MRIKGSWRRGASSNLQYQHDRTFGDGIEECWQIEDVPGLRKLNLATKDDAFPDSCIQDCLDVLAGATIYFTMDVTAANYYIPFAEKDIQRQHS